MKFTVWGSNGFIGRHLVKHLRTAGHHIQTPARGDLASTADMGHVVYAIGMTSNFIHQPFNTVDAHVTQLARLLEGGRFQSFLYLSSTRLYGTQPGGGESSSVTVQPGNPSDLYNLSKLMGESLCLHCQRPGVRIARLSNVVGPHQASSGNFLDAITTAAMNGTIELQSAPESEKNYVALPDVLAMIPRISLTGTDTIYNIAGGRCISHGEWIELLTSVFSCQVHIPQRPIALKLTNPSIRKIQSEFGFEPMSALDYYKTLLSTTFTTPEPIRGGT